jgi:hypothetical protein
MTRVINIFKRADQVDDTFEVAKSDRRVTKGETAKHGDNGLELHECVASSRSLDVWVALSLPARCCLV